MEEVSAVGSVAQQDEDAVEPSGTLEAGEATEEDGGDPTEHDEESEQRQAEPGVEPKGKQRRNEKHPGGRERQMRPDEWSSPGFKVADQDS